MIPEEQERFAKAVLEMMTHGSGFDIIVTMDLHNEVKSVSVFQSQLEQFLRRALDDHKELAQIRMFFHRLTLPERVTI